MWLMLSRCYTVLIPVLYVLIPGYSETNMATSCENNRTQAYSEDLRWRMIYRVMMLHESYRAVGVHLNVDSSTVWRTVSLFKETGNVCKRNYPANSGTQKLTEIDKLIILEAVLDRPGIYLHEVKDKLLEETGTEVNSSTVCRFLHQSGFSRQKMILNAKQRSDFLRAKYLLDVSIYKNSPELLVFIDETGADRRDSMRKFAYSLRGKPAVVNKLMVRGHRVSAIVGMSWSGILDFHITVSTVNADKFHHYVEDALSPYLQAFNGTNANSVVILDNASIHHNEEVLDSIQDTGALVQFLPPYSPDMNPIEHAFAQVKSVLKANEDTWKDLDIETIVTAALNTITPMDCRAWISHCGY